MDDTHIGYELVYGTGGHGGPHWGLDNARQWALKHLAGCPSEYVVYIVPRSAIHYSSKYAVETVSRTQLERQYYENGLGI